MANSRQFPLSRREFMTAVAAAGTPLVLPASALAQESPEKTAAFTPRYVLASCMYGYTELAEILPEVHKIGATAIDIWPKVHGNQREQLDEMGEDRFAELLAEHNVSLGCITQYKLGPFKLQDEMRLAKRLGCELIVTGGRGPVGLKGNDLKSAVKDFVLKMQPHLAVARECGITVAIENHGNNLIDSPDSLKWLAELGASQRLGVALAPYHLPQDETLLADLIRSLDGSIHMFYAWQHGMGCKEKLPKEQELLQMPGRGPLNFRPLLKALADIRYTGWTEIFMHPVPRGIPILDTTKDVTAEINRARKYIQQRVAAG